MGNKFNRQNRQESSRQQNTSEPMDEQSGKMDDPRVRAFIRNYAPIVNQDDPDAIILNLPRLRQFFNAYPTANGFDPMKMILNQLEKNDFPLQADWHKDELILVVKRVMIFINQPANILPMPENN